MGSEDRKRDHQVPRRPCPPSMVVNQPDFGSSSYASVGNTTYFDGNSRQYLGSTPLSAQEVIPTQQSGNRHTYNDYREQARQGSHTWDQAASRDLDASQGCDQMTSPDQSAYKADSNPGAAEYHLGSGASHRAENPEKKCFVSYLIIRYSRPERDNHTIETY